MGIRSQMMGQAKQILEGSRSRNRTSSSGASVPRGHFPVCVGESKKRFVVPVSYLRHPKFQSLLQRAEEEFGYDHRMGVLRVPCHENDFLHLTSQLA